MALSKFEVQGEWWLPGHESTKVPGTLSFDPEHGSELALMGSLRGMFDGAEPTQSDDGTVTIEMGTEALAKAGTYPRIHGQVAAKAYTLDNCFRTYLSSPFNTGQSTEKISVGAVLAGALFDIDEDLTAEGISLELRYLTHWRMATGLSEQHAWSENPSPEEDGITITGRRLPEQRTRGASGEQVVLRHSIGLSGDHVTKRALTQQFYFRVSTKKLQSLDSLIDLASDLQDLVSIATNRTAEIDAFRFWHPDVYWQPTPTAKKHPEPVEYVVPWNARDKSAEPVDLHAHQMLFTYPEFGGIRGVGRWLRTAQRHRDALGRVMSSRYAAQMFVSDRLLNRAAALEAYDREVTGHKNTKFKTRITRCAALAGEPFLGLVGDLAAWAEVIRLDRDDIAHHFGRRMKHSSADQYFLAESLYWLFVFCLLRDCRAPQKVFQRIGEHQALRGAGPRIQSAIANWP